MKKLLFIALLLLTSELIHAQSPYSLFYLKKGEIRKKFAEFYDCSYVASKNYKGIMYDSYHQNNGNDLIACFFNKSGLCFQVMVIYPYSEYTVKVNSININFIKIKDLKWRDNSETTTVELSPVNRQLFSLTFTCIDLK